MLKCCQCFPDLCGLRSGKTDGVAGLRCVYVFAGAQQWWKAVHLLKNNVELLVLGVFPQYATYLGNVAFFTLWHLFNRFFLKKYIVCFSNMLYTHTKKVALHYKGAVSSF